MTENNPNDPQNNAASNPTETHEEAAQRLLKEHQERQAQGHGQQRQPRNDQKTMRDQLMGIN